MPVLLRPVNNFLGQVIENASKGKYNTVNNSSSGEVTFQKCLKSGITLFSSKNSNKSQTFATVVRGSNAYFWSNLESGSKVFFSMFSCYIGIVLHETAWWHSYNIEHFYITRFIISRQSGRKIMILHGSKNTNIYIKHQTNLYLPSLEIVCLQCLQKWSPNCTNWFNQKFWVMWTLWPQGLS